MGFFRFSHDHLTAFLLNAECCHRSYVESCPENFVPKEIPPTEWYYRTQRVCQPGQNYGGPCWGDVDFSNKSVAELQEWAKRCGTNWPCKTHCEKNIPSVCPEKWKFIGQGVCVAPSDYRGPCPLTGNFEHWSPCKKTQYANKCGVSWPCTPTVNDATEHGPSPALPNTRTRENTQLATHPMKPLSTNVLKDTSSFL